LYESFGCGWPHAINSLYKDSFPKAIETYTKQDAIVVNTNNHYKTTKVKLLIDDIRYISQQAACSKALVYLMEPNAEEWLTSNGIFICDCEKSCHCAALMVECLQASIIPKVMGGQSITLIAFVVTHWYNIHSFHRFVHGSTIGLVRLNKRAPSSFLSINLVHISTRVKRLPTIMLAVISTA